MSRKILKSILLSLLVILFLLNVKIFVFDEARSREHRVTIAIVEMDFVFLLLKNPHLPIEKIESNMKQAGYNEIQSFQSKYVLYSKTKLGSQYDYWVLISFNATPSIPYSRQFYCFMADYKSENLYQYLGKDYMTATINVNKNIWDIKDRDKQRKKIRDIILKYYLNEVLYKNPDKTRILRLEAEKKNNNQGD